MFKKRIFLFLMSFCLILGLAGCTITSKTVRVEFDSDAYSVRIGQTLDINLNITTGAYYNKDDVAKQIVYSSTDETVATFVDGKLTGVGIGEADIKVKWSEKAIVYDVAKVVVKLNSLPALVFEDVSSNMLKGTSQTVGYKLSTIYTDAKVEFESANADIATVTADGKITAVAPGEATIIAYVVDGEERQPYVLKINVSESDFAIEYVLDGGVNHVDNPAGYNLLHLPVALQEPTKANYKFLGWYLNDKLVTEISEGVTGNIKLVAKWELSEFKVALDVNNGTWPEGVTPITSYTAGSAVELPTPVRTGYTFDGWYNASEEKVEGITAETTGDLALTAKWTVVKYNITYTLDGGKFLSAALYEDKAALVAAFLADFNAVTGGATVAAKFFDDSYNGNLIKMMAANGNTAKWQWFIDALNAVRVASGKAATSVSSEATMRAEIHSFLNDQNRTKWPSSSDYTVAANVQAVVDAIPVDETIKKPVYNYTVEDEIVFVSPVKEGYTFLGWKNAEEKVVTGIAKGSTGDVTVTATWKRNYDPEAVLTVKYELGGGVLPEGTATTFIAKDGIPTLPVATRNGYKFNGWFSDEELTTAVTSVEAGLMAGVTLYASWSAEEYTIEYDLDGGTFSVDSVAPLYDTIALFAEAFVADYAKFFNLTGVTAANFMSKSADYGVASFINNEAMAAKWNWVIEFLLAQAKATNYAGNIYLVNQSNLANYNKYMRANLYALLNQTKYPNVPISMDFSDLTYEVFSKVMPTKVVTVAANPKYKYTVEELPLKLETPMKGTVKFLGWYFAKTYKGEAMTELPEGTTGNIKLFARFEDSIAEVEPGSIEYVLDGGVLPEDAPKEFLPGTALTLPTPTKKFYTFLGWSFDEAGATIITEIPADYKGGAKVYAHWETKALIVDAAGTTDYKTIAEALAVAKEGDTIVVLAGTYADDFKISVNNITIASYNADINPNDTNVQRVAEAIITGKVTLAEGLTGATINGLAFTGASNITGANNVSKFTFKYNNWLGTTLTSSSAALIDFAASTNVDVSNFDISYNRIVKVYGEITATDCPRYFRFYNITGLNMVGNYLLCGSGYADVLRVDNASQGLGGNVLIENNEFLHCGQFALFIKGWCTNNLIIRNNVFSNTDVTETSAGLLEFRTCTGATGQVLIEYNEFLVGWRAVRLELQGCTAEKITITVRYNEFIDLQSETKTSSYYISDNKTSAGAKINAANNYFKLYDGTNAERLFPSPNVIGYDTKYAKPEDIPAEADAEYTINYVLNDGTFKYTETVSYDTYDKVVAAVLKDFGLKSVSKWASNIDDLFIANLDKWGWLLDYFISVHTDKFKAALENTRKGIDQTGEENPYAVTGELKAFVEKGLVEYPSAGISSADYKKEEIRSKYSDFAPEPTNIEKEIEHATSYKNADLPIALATPLREGYKFEGWFLDPEFTQPVEKIEENLGNVTLYAKWKAILVYSQITYELDGGVLPDGAPTEYLEGTGIATLPIMTKDNFYFLGWGLTADATEYVTSIGTDVTGDIKLFAIFLEMKEVTVTYVLNGGYIQYESREALVADFLKDFGKVLEKEVTADGLWAVGNVYNKLFDDPALFQKWSWLLLYFYDLGNDGVGFHEESQAQYREFIAGNGDSVTSQWALRQNIQGFMTLTKCGKFSGAAAIDFGQYKYAYGYTEYQEGTSYIKTAKTLVTPHRDFYKFVGWYDNAAFTGEPVTMLVKDCTLYAKWEKVMYTATFVLGNAQATMDSLTVEFSPIDGLTLPTPKFEALAWTWNGWFANAELTGSKVTEIAKYALGDVTFYGSWTEITGYDVTYNLNGGNMTYETRAKMVEDFLVDYNAYGGTAYTLADLPQGAWANINFHTWYYSTPEMATKWRWLVNYLAEVGSSANSPVFKAIVKGTVTSVDTLKAANSNYVYQFSYEVRGFMLGKLFDSNKNYLSSDYSDFDLANGFWAKFAELENTKRTNLHGSVECAKAWKLGFVLEGWYTTADFQDGTKVTSTTDAATLYAKWIEETPVTDITVGEMPTTMVRGTTVQLTYAVVPANAPNNKVFFATTDKDIVEVSSTGLLTAHNAGTAKITITDQMGHVNKEYTIVVPEIDQITATFATTYHGTLAVDEEIQINGGIIGQYSTCKLVYKSADDAIATVSETGLIKGVKAGYVVITVSVEGHTEINLTIGVNVTGTSEADDVQKVLDLLTAANQATVWTNNVQLYDDGSKIYLVPTYGSVNLFLFDNLNLDSTTYLVADPENYGSCGGKMTSVEFVTIHDTANLSGGLAGHGNYWKSDAGVSIHFTTGDKGAIQDLSKEYVGYHAGDGTTTEFKWEDTGVKSTTATPLIAISADGYFTFNDKKTTIVAPTGKENEILDASYFTTQGPSWKVGDNGNYYLGTTWFCTSQVSRGVIASHGGNNNSIGIEQCVNTSGDIFDTWQRTAKLVGSLLNEFKLDTSRVKQHNAFSGKNCPQSMRSSNTWGMFMETVALEQEIQSKYKDAVITMKSDNEAIVSNTGRVVAAPVTTQSVSYTITVKIGEVSRSIKLSSVIPGQSSWKQLSGFYSK